MQELEKRKLDFKYSVIINFKQFDFGNKLYRILLEVNGDYWHGNPLFYGLGKNKKPLNETQKNKIQVDISKKEFAQKHNITLFTIWENEIKNNNFSVIDTIERLINNE